MGVREGAHRLAKPALNNGRIQKLARRALLALGGRDNVRGDRVDMLPQDTAWPADRAAWCNSRSSPRRRAFAGRWAS